MANQTTHIIGNKGVPTAPLNENGNPQWKTITLIAITVIGLSVIAVGLSGYGVQKMWWNAGLLNHLGSNGSIAMLAAGSVIAAGGIITIVCIHFPIMNLVRSVKHPEYFKPLPTSRIKNGLNNEVEVSQRQFNAELRPDMQKYSDGL